MATSSIKKNIVIDDEQSANKFVEALEKAMELSNGINMNHIDNLKSIDIKAKELKVKELKGEEIREYFKDTL